ncbi:hypothetical protein [Streptomyces sp. NPDC047706]|uniref:hypothetical protein n=1 Tax=Streptomyces sp. NPDC047706 TaxID=3365486 RepID=UPI003720CE49
MRLTGETDPEPLARLVSVDVRDTYELYVRWRSGPTARFRFTVPDEASAVPSWTVRAG